MSSLLELVAAQEADESVDTSGTTSRPKGVETTYRGTYLAAVANAVESGLGRDSVYLWILPMFHCLGWCFPYACTMIMCTQVGSAIMLARARELMVRAGLHAGRR